MRSVFFILAILTMLSPAAGKAMVKKAIPIPLVDTIPAPPGNNIPLTGPSEACVSDTCIYFADVPVACTCQWTLNGVIQPVSDEKFEIVWEQPGLFTVGLNFVCSNGQSGTAGNIEVEVSEEPEVYLGPDTTINQGQSIVLDAGNPGSSYLWSTGDTTQTIEVSQAGIYSVTVTNYCGNDWDDIEVSVITVINEQEQAFDGKMYYNGKILRFEPGTSSVVNLKIIASSGKLLYDGPIIDAFRPERKGLYIVVLTTKKDQVISKLMVQ
jgi:hypothetical protein